MNLNRDLKALREHATHKATWTSGPAVGSCRTESKRGEALVPNHGICRDGTCGCDCHAPQNESDRTLWAQIAEEIDTHFGSEPDQLGLDFEASS